ncbi:MAG: disulfide bond formation protein B, partial [Pelagibacteraceae bacterium]
HIGIEQNIFSETKACKATGSILNQEDLLKQFETNKIAGCANVNFTLLGMSLSSLNFIMNIVFLAIYAFIIKNEKK